MLFKRVCWVKHFIEVRSTCSSRSEQLIRPVRLAQAKADFDLSSAETSSVASAAPVAESAKCGRSNWSEERRLKRALCFAEIPDDKNAKARRVSRTTAEQRMVPLSEVKGSVGVFASVLEQRRMPPSCPQLSPPRRVRSSPPRRVRGKGRDWSQCGRLALASKAEVGPEWHCEGRRKWAWMHDGAEVNGWFELCANGRLRTSFSQSYGSWERLHGSTDLAVSFGKCRHVLEIIGAGPLFSRPRFILRDRMMLSGEALRDRRPFVTRGFLLV